MNCQEVSDLLPAYVLGALEPDEVASIEAHLRAGHEHDEELIELRATVFALDRFSGDAVPAPSAVLADRVAGITAGGRRLAALDTRPSGRIALPPIWQAVAAVLALVFVFGAGWFGSRAFDDGSEREFSYVVQGASGEVVGLSGEESSDSVTVTMAGLDRLPSGSSYQLWAIRDGTWFSIGVCNTDADGWWVGDFAFALHSGEEIALTVEPAGGSAKPTTKPLLRTAWD